MLKRTIHNLSWHQIFFQIFHKVGLKGSLFRSNLDLQTLNIPADTTFLSHDIFNSNWISSNKIEILGIIFTLDDLLKNGFDTESDGIVLDTLSYLRFVSSNSNLNDEDLKNTIGFLDNFKTYCDENPSSKAFSTSFNSVERVYSLLRFIGMFQARLSNEEKQNLVLQINDNANHIYFDQEARLGGNHHLRNLLCLSLLMDLFEGNKTNASFKNRLYRRTIQELTSQFLEDGMHFEISPGYHRLILMDILNYLELTKDKESVVSKFLKLHLAKYLEALTFFSLGDRLPQFNDNLPDSFPDNHEILNYSSKFLSQKVIRPLSLKDSGFYRLDTKNLSLFCKSGHQGAKNQPGHIHSDNLSFEIYDGDCWICGNSPTLTYNPGSHRDMSRSEKGSSAPFIEGFFQAEFWSTFRVGKISGASQILSYEKDHNEISLSVSHKYENLKKQKLVERNFKRLNNYLIVETVMKKNETYTSNIFFDNLSEVSIHQSSISIHKLDSKINIQLEGCLIDGEIKSIYSDLHNNNFNYFTIKNYDPVSKFTFSNFD